MTDTEDIAQRLEAKAEELGEQPENLTIVPEDRVQEAEELSEEVESLEDTVEELQAQIETKEETIEEMEEEVDYVKSIYAEDLSDGVFTADELKQKFDVEELRKKHEKAREEDKIESLSPNPRSADGVGNTHSGADMQESDTAEAGDGETGSIPEELQEKMEKRGGAWADG